MGGKSIALPCSSRIMGRKIIRSEFPRTEIISTVSKFGKLFRKEILLKGIVPYLAPSGEHKAHHFASVIDELYGIFLAPFISAALWF